MSEDGYGVCDVCGQPATSMARDVMRYDDGDAWWHFRPLVTVKRGCQEHPAESVIYDDAMHPVAEPAK